MITSTIRLSEQENKVLSTIAQETGKTQSELLHEAVQTFIIQFLKVDASSLHQKPAIEQRGKLDFLLLLIQEMLDSEQLPEADKLAFVVEVIQRSKYIEWGTISDEELVLNAENLFLELDAYEEQHGDF
ncbi:MAG: hypothetical protein U0350_19130 [Caldilineaceae bacterium]